MDAEGGAGAEYGCENRGQQRNDKGVEQQRQQYAVDEKLLIVVKGKTLENRYVHAAIEGADSQHYHGDIEEKEH